MTPDDERYRYAAVICPDWESAVIRQHHPTGGADVFVLAEQIRSPRRAASVVLLHGVGNSGDVFAPIMPALATLGRVIAPTVPASLLAEGIRPGEPGAAHAAADGLVSWLEQVAPAPWHLVGHSMGGVLTGMILRTHPELVTSAVLLNAPLPSVTRRIRGRDGLDRTGRALLTMKALAQVTAFGRPRLPGFLRGPELAVVRNALRGFVADAGALDGAVIGRAIMSSRTADARDFLRLARQLPEWETSDFTVCPVRIVLGHDDPLVPRSDHAAIAERYPAAAIRVLPRCSHFAHLEHPQAVVDEIGRSVARGGRLYGARP